MSTQYSNGDLERLKWTLKDGNSPMQRIYSTLKALYSQMTYGAVEAMVADQVDKGLLTTSEHPFHKGEYFYGLNPKMIERED